MTLHGLIVNFRLPDNDRELEYMPPVLFTTSKALTDNLDYVLEVFEKEFDVEPDVKGYYERRFQVIA